jgi:hypothetical protein
MGLQHARESELMTKTSFHAFSASLQQASEVGMVADWLESQGNLDMRDLGWKNQKKDLLFPTTWWNNYMKVLNAICPVDIYTIRPKTTDCLQLPWVARWVSNPFKKPAPTPGKNNVHGS